MDRFGAGLVAALTLASFMACGGNTNDASGAPEKESPGAGSGGSRSKPAQPDDGSGGDKVGTGGHSAGSGGESGDSGLPEPDGEGGDGPVGDVVAETEKGIDPALAITDPALLGGKSFVLPKGLCPEHAPSEWWYETYPYAGSALRTLHLVRKGDALELLSSTRTSTSPVIQRTILEPTSSGFRATDLVVCTDAIYEFEDTYRIARYETPLAHLVFVPGETPDTVEVAFGAWLEPDDETVVLTGKPDHEPPSFHPLDVPGEQLYTGTGSWDPVTPGGVLPPYHFFFDEPVLDGDLSLDDGFGNTVTPSKYMSGGLLVGFSVDTFILGTPALNLAVSDLAGNAWVSGPTYPGITLPALGDIEARSDYVEYDEYDDHSTSLLTELTGEDAWIGDVPVPPLSGARSLYLREATVYLRVARSPDATKLGFGARAIEGQADITVSIQALEDGAASSWLLDQDPATPGGDVAWVEDPAYGDAFVSLPEKLSAPLPETGDDLLVRVDVDGQLWLDSLVTE